MTRQEIFDALRQLTDKQLETVFSFSQTAKMLYPEKDLLQNANFSQMLSKASELRQVHMPEWNDDGNGDFGTFLLELVALFSEKDFQYQNIYAQEVTARTMTIYRNLYSRAFELGYHPQVTTSGEMNVQLTFAPNISVNPQNPYDTLPVGSINVQHPRTKIRLVNLEPIVIPQSLSQANHTVVLREGTYTSESVVFNGRFVYLNTFNIDPNSVSVEVDGVVYRKVSQFVNSGSTDKHFVVIPESSGRATISFGDNTFGYLPAEGAAITVYFLVTSGAIASSKLIESGESFKVNTSPELRQIVSAVSVDGLGVVGGKMADTASMIRNNMPKGVFNRGIVIHKTDAKDFLLNQPDISKATSIYQSGLITLYAMDFSGNDLSTSRKSELVAELEQIIPQFDYQVSFQPLVYETLPNMYVLIEGMPGVSLSALETVVIQAITEFYSPVDFGDFGRRFVYDDLFVHVKNRAGVNLARLTFYASSDYSTTKYSEYVAIARNRIFAQPVFDTNLFAQTQYI